MAFECVCDYQGGMVQVWYVERSAYDALVKELQDDTVSARKRIEDLCNENTALAAKLEQAERERDEAQKYAELRDRQVTIINEKAQTDIARLTRELEEVMATSTKQFHELAKLRAVVEAAKARLRVVATSMAASGHTSRARMLNAIADEILALEEEK